jgi:hypothetical protein
MEKYKNLTDAKVEEYQSKLILPSIDFPHYERLVKEGIVVRSYEEVKPINGERFEKSGYLKNENAKELLISNYGRVIYDNILLKPFIVGTFLHCLKVYINKIGEFYVHRIVQETFDPIEDMNNLQVHHISNNALDNSLDNLLWVSKDDHDRIHDRNFKFTQEIMEIGKNIWKKTKNELSELFHKNIRKIFSGKELIDYFKNVSYEVIRDNTYSLVKENIIVDITEKDNFVFKNKTFKLNIKRGYSNPNEAPTVYVETYEEAISFLKEFLE